jgi:hypothetical protein
MDLVTDLVLAHHLYRVMLLVVLAHPVLAPGLLAPTMVMLHTSILL